jgi:hypothetical protein
MLEKHILHKVADRIRDISYCTLMLNYYLRRRPMFYMFYTYGLLPLLPAPPLHQALHSQMIEGTKVKTGNHLIILNERTTGFRYFGNK